MFHKDKRVSKRHRTNQPLTDFLFCFFLSTATLRFNEWVFKRKKKCTVTQTQRPPTSSERCVNIVENLSGALAKIQWRDIFQNVDVKSAINNLLFFFNLHKVSRGHLFLPSNKYTPTLHPTSVFVAWIDTDLDGLGDYRSRLRAASFRRQLGWRRVASTPRVALNGPSCEL